MTINFLYLINVAEKQLEIINPCDFINIKNAKQTALLFCQVKLGKSAYS